MQEVRDLFRAGRWDEAVAWCEELDSRSRREPEVRLLYAIALIRAGRVASGLNMLGDDVVGLPTARTDLRRLVVPALIKEGRYANAATVLEKMVAVGPNSIDDLRTLVSVLSRANRADEAVAISERIVRLEPDSAVDQATLLQRLMSVGRGQDAARHALSLGQKLLAHPRLTALGLLALTRAGESEEAAAIAQSADHQSINDDQSAAAIVRALYEAQLTSEAAQAGEAFLARGLHNGTLSLFTALALMQTAAADRYERVAQHLESAHRAGEANALAYATLGEALLRMRRFAEALPHLATAVELDPKMANARALYARALKQAGRYADAAAEFRALLKLQPSSGNWHRYAAGALAQAGRRDEATALFDQFVSSRAGALPASFEEGLEALWSRVDQVKVPQARLDWAWSLRLSDEPVNRTEWERSATWGHLADHYLLDWLECRGDRAHEAMMRLADLGSAETVLQAVDRSRGLILASCHIGAMYAGPLALELLGIPARWLASTPSVARTAYANSLISTSDQDDLQVARAFRTTLQEGKAVVVAVDGAINLGAPRIPFAGQEITYSSFAAKMAQRHGAPSFFVAPHWEGDHIGFTLERLPDAEQGEDTEQFADRWRDAFLESLRNFLGGDPRNLRLSGGIWRHIH